MDTIIRSYTRLQAIGKACTIGAWAVLVIGALVFCYVGFVVYPPLNAYAGNSSALFFQFLFLIGIMVIPIGALSLLLFASGALIEYITIQDAPSQEDGDEDVESAQGAGVQADQQDQEEHFQLDIASIPESERNTLA